MTFTSTRPLHWMCLQALNVLMASQADSVLIKKYMNLPRLEPSHLTHDFTFLQEHGDGKDGDMCHYWAVLHPGAVCVVPGAILFFRE